MNQPIEPVRDGCRRLYHNDIRTLQIPELLDMVAEIQSLRVWLSMTLRASFRKCALTDHSVGKIIYRRGLSSRIGEAD